MIVSYIITITYNVLQQKRKGLQRSVTSVDLIGEECWRSSLIKYLRVKKKPDEVWSDPQKLDTLLTRQPGTEFCIEQDSVLLVLP